MYLYRNGYALNKVDNCAFADQYDLTEREQSPTIFDIGANIGQTAKIYLSRYPAAQIHCFEPLFERPEILKKAIDLKWNKKAISNRTGTVSFFENSSTDTSSTLRARSDGVPTGYLQVADNHKHISVESETIDNYCMANNIERIDILKMDIQGGELKALNGAKNMLSTQSIDLIYLEMYFLEFYSGQPLAGDIVGFLVNSGYNLHSIYNCSFSGKNGRLMWCDAIFVRNSIGKRSRNILENWLVD